MAERTRDQFRVEVDVEWDAVGVPSVKWTRSGSADWESRPRKHKAPGRRRMTRDVVRATEGGVR